MAGRISLSQVVEEAHQQGQCPPNPILTGPPRGQVRKLGRGRDERSRVLETLRGYLGFRRKTHVGKSA